MAELLRGKASTVFTVFHSIVYLPVNHGLVDWQYKSTKVLQQSFTANNHFSLKI